MDHKYIHFIIVFVYANLFSINKILSSGLNVNSYINFREVIKYSSILESKEPDTERKKQSHNCFLILLENIENCEFHYSMILKI